MNTWGQLFRVTSFGESHGKGLGIVVDGCPSGVNFNFELLQYNLSRRRPGQSNIVSARNEADQFEVLSGVFEGKTLGTPIALVIYNQNARSEDYQAIKNNPRPGHADDIWRAKYQNVDHRGGGRASGRETVSRVLAGSIAQMLVQQLNPETQVLGFASQIGPLQLDETKETLLKEINFQSQRLDKYPARFPHSEKSQQIQQMLLKAKEEGESYGGTVEVRVQSPQAYLGQPVFKKFKSDLAAAIMSIGATCAVDFGNAESAVHDQGTQFHNTGNAPYGGLRGGITTGETLEFSVKFKPTSSILDVAKKGRHDPCIIPRAIPVVEAMTWLTLAEHSLWRRLDNI